MKHKLLIVGAAGRMGKRLVSVAAGSEKFEIVGAVDRKGLPEIGKDAGLVAGFKTIKVELSSEYPPGADVAIDFSQSEAADATIEYCTSEKCPLIMGTTGLANEQKQKITNAASHIPVICGTNMSVGMNVLFEMVGKFAAMLGEDYDIEIIEQHHRFKKDAPSGSALTLAENICSATKRSFPDCLVHGREGKDALREKGSIGMHAVRAGDITGNHSVTFTTLGEKIELNHTAQSRDTFVLGALRAADWLVNREPGMYSMADVLGLK
ncbi:MAG: 4-hydroxy-tetrahydrodipicolinate reductase [Planctomycetota bacterium]|jgi:4-hydroxy-tetrahydrodipicolinate reductase